MCGFAALSLASSKQLLDPPIVCDDLRSAIQKVAAMNRKVPFLIRILTWFAGLATAAMLLSILLAVCGIGPTMMGGERVTRSEWLHIAAPLVAVIGFLMALISYGFAKQKPWSRRLVIAIFGLIIVYAVVTGALGLIRPAIVWRAIGNGAVFGCVSVWYFYFKPNVVAYFRELAQR
jgi:hypothetical protein